MRNYLRENDDSSTPESGISSERAKYDLILMPENVSYIEALKALDNIDNYGIYAANLKNVSAGLSQALEDYFGPSIPVRKRSAEKLRGKPFPPKTKAAIDAFTKEWIENYGGNKVRLLVYKVGPGKTIVFPYDKNPAKEVTRKMIDTVMKNAGIEYRTTEAEHIDEATRIRVSKLIKEVLKKNER